MINLCPSKLKHCCAVIILFLFSFNLLNGQTVALTDLHFSTYNGVIKSTGSATGSAYNSHDMSPITNGYGRTVQMNNTSHYIKIDLQNVDNPISHPGYIQYYLESNNSSASRTLLVQWSADDVTYTTLYTHLSENEPVSSPTLYNLMVDPSARYILFDMTERTNNRFELDNIIVSSKPIPATPPGSYAYGNTTYQTGVYDVDVLEGGITTYDGTAVTGFYDYTEQRKNLITITEGIASTLEVDFDTDGNYSVYGLAWIDWNADGDFTDAGEEYDLGSATNCNCLSSLTPTITAAAGKGQASYNMRIAAKYGSYPSSPTETGQDAEVEDWIIYVDSDVDFTWTGGGDPSNWTDVGNWNQGTAPTSLDNCIIPSSPAGDFPGLLVGGNCNNLIIEAGAEFSILSPVTLFVDGDLTSDGVVDIRDGKLDIAGGGIFNRGAIVLDGAIEVDGATTIGAGYDLDNGNLFDANGDFDATGANILMGPSANLSLASMVSSLGTLDAAEGTVIYDGTSEQTIVADNYYNLIIENASTKTAAGNLDIDGDLNTEAEASCILDLATYNLNISGNLTVGQEGGLDASDASCIVTFDGTSSIVTHAGSLEGSTVAANGSNTTDYGISDLSTITSDIVLSTSLTTSDIASVTINLTHTYDADLEITLIAPNGSSIDLSSDNGGSGNNFTNTVFQSAGAAITSGAAPFTGTFTPEQAFTGLTGTANGTWTLSIYDDAGADQGTLLDWSISLSRTTYTSINPTFNQVVVNGPDITLADKMDILDDLTLTSGDITSDATNKLTIKLGGSITGGSDNSHVLGPMDYETASISEITLPMGDGLRYRPVFITPATSSVETWTAEYFNSSYANMTCNGADIDHVAPDIYWDVSNVNGEECTMGLTWNENINVDVPADIILAHWDNLGTTWEKINALTQTLTGSNGTGSATAADGRISAYVDAYSPFNLGSGSGNNPLPIDLLSFTAGCSHDIVDVDFSVISQVNNDYFLVEKSKDATHWEELGTIEGAGTTNSQIDYNMVDGAAEHGLSYYRLTQVDYDGESKTFAPVSVSCESLAAGLPIQVYPNPMINEFTIEIDLQDYQGNDVYYTILDARGAIIQTENIILNRGYNQHVIDVQNLSNGVYILRFNNTRDHILEKRIVKK